MLLLIITPYRIRFFNQRFWIIPTQSELKLVTGYRQKGRILRGGGIHMKDISIVQRLHFPKISNQRFMICVSECAKTLQLKVIL